MVTYVGYTSKRQAIISHHHEINKSPQYHIQSKQEPKNEYQKRGYNAKGRDRTSKITHQRDAHSYGFLPRTFFQPGKAKNRELINTLTRLDWDPHSPDPHLQGTRYKV